MLTLFQHHCIARLKSIINKCDTLKKIEKAKYWIEFEPRIHMIASWNRKEIEDLLQKNTANN